MIGTFTKDFSQVPISQLGKLHIWEVATWENTLGKLPLKKKSFWKVPNIYYYPPLLKYYQIYLRPKIVLSKYFSIHHILRTEETV